MSLKSNVIQRNCILNINMFMKHIYRNYHIMKIYSQQKKSIFSFTCPTSVLAIFETLLAMFSMLYIILNYQTNFIFYYLYFTPIFLLVRDDKINIDTINILGIILKKYDNLYSLLVDKYAYPFRYISAIFYKIYKKNNSFIINILIGLISVPMFFFSIVSKFTFIILIDIIINNIMLIVLILTTKVIVYFKHLFKRPKQLILNIPENFKKVVLCYDLSTPKEIIPEFEKYRRNHEVLDKKIFILTSYSIMKFFSISHDLNHEEISDKNKKQFKKSIRYNFLKSFNNKQISFEILKIIVFFYRFALKSTALIWLPLVLINKKVNHFNNLNKYLQFLTVSPVEQLIKVLSVLSVIFLVSSFINEDIIKQIPILTLFNTKDIYLWNIGSLIVSIITFYIWYYTASFKLEKPDVVNTSNLYTAIPLLVSIRSFIGIYLIVINIYLFSKIIEIPNFKLFIVFPWN